MEHLNQDPCSYTTSLIMSLEFMTTEKKNIYSDMKISSELSQMNLTDQKAVLKTVMGTSKRQGLEMFSLLAVPVAEVIRVHQILSYQHSDLLISNSTKLMLFVLLSTHSPLAENTSSSTEPYCENIHLSIGLTVIKVVALKSHILNKRRLFFFKESE